MVLYGRNAPAVIGTIIVLSTAVDGVERRRSNCDYYWSRSSCDQDSECQWICDDGYCYCDDTIIPGWMVALIVIGVIGFYCFLCGYFLYQRRRRQSRIHVAGQVVEMPATQVNYHSPVPPAVSYPQSAPHIQRIGAPAPTYNAAQPSPYNAPPSGHYNAAAPYNVSSAGPYYAPPGGGYNAPPSGTSYNSGQAGYGPPPPAYEPQRHVGAA